MRPAAFSLFLIVVHVCVPGECRPRIPDPEERQRNIGDDPTTGGVRPFKTELNGSIKKGFDRQPLVIVPVRRDTGDLVSIFSLEKGFVCMDSDGLLYNSRHNYKDDCLYQRIWSDPSEFFYSLSTGRLFRPEGTTRQVGQKASPKAPSTVLRKLFGALTKRKRRSTKVNPSDPLSTEPDPQDPDMGPPVKDQAGSMSKETLPSCDDPLKVLQPSVPGSPVKTNRQTEHNPTERPDYQN